MKSAVFLTVGFLMSSFCVSCSSKKELDGKIVKGNYEIVKVERIENEKARIICFVYNKESNTPIVNAAISIDELKLAGLTKENGQYEFEVVGGKSIVTVINVGNTSIRTKRIYFKPYTRTEIKFLLGTAIIY